MRCDSAGGGSRGWGVKCLISVQINKTSFLGTLPLRYGRLYLKTHLQTSAIIYPVSRSFLFFCDCAVRRSTSSSTKATNCWMNELRSWSPTTYSDLFGVGCRQVDDVGHLFEELFGLVQQLQNVSGMKSLKKKEKKKRVPKSTQRI